MRTIASMGGSWDGIVTSCSRESNKRQHAIPLEEDKLQQQAVSS